MGQTRCNHYPEAEALTQHEQESHDEQEHVAQPQVAGSMLAKGCYYRSDSKTVLIEDE